MGPAFSCQAFCILEFKKLSGEDAACPDYSEWFHQFKRDILPLYDPRDVFNADETALMWRACSGFCLCCQENTLRVARSAKIESRLTSSQHDRDGEAAAVNHRQEQKSKMLHTEGRPKSWKPPNVSYTHSAKAWMNKRIWDAWLNNLNADMKRQKRKILLAVDNYSAHNTETAYSNLRIEYLPANTTSRCQPMDQGCILSFKSKFRRRLANMLLDVKSPQDISLLHAIMMASQSWSQVEPQLIRNVFNKAWQMLPEPEVVVVEADELQDADFGSDSQIAQAQDDELFDQDVLDIENGEPTEEPEETDTDKLYDTHIQDLLDAAAAEEEEEQLQYPPQGSGVSAAGPTLLDANQMLQMLRQIQRITLLWKASSLRLTRSHFVRLHCCKCGKPASSSNYRLR